MAMTAMKITRGQGVRGSESGLVEFGDVTSSNTTRFRGHRLIFNYVADIYLTRSPVKELVLALRDFYLGALRPIECRRTVRDIQGSTATFPCRPCYRPCQARRFGTRVNGVGSNMIAVAPPEGHPFRRMSFFFHNNSNCRGLFSDH